MAKSEMRFDEAKANHLIRLDDFGIEDTHTMVVRV